MYYRLRSALKRRLIEELKDSFGRHPIYNKITSSIQDRYSWETRPQFGIVVKGSNVSKVALSGDNFMGTLESFVMLTHVPGKLPAYPVEWVREDSPVIERNGGVMPTPPGAYFLEILEAPERVGDTGQFIIDPLLRISGEPVIRFQTGFEQEATLAHDPIPGTLRLYENGKILLLQGRDYNISGRKIQFLTRFYKNYRIDADYYREGESIGPIPFQWERANRSALPGVVIAFGKRAVKNDKVVIAITKEREDTANVYGGKFELSFDMDVLARDTIQAEEITDLILMYLWSDKKGVLEDDGIEITDISSGGESEESYDDTSGDSYYTTNISISLRSDWEYHEPLPLSIAKVVPYSAEVESTLNYAREAPPSDLIQIYQGHPLLLQYGPVFFSPSSLRERIH